MDVSESIEVYEKSGEDVWEKGLRMGFPLKNSEWLKKMKRNIGGKDKARSHPKSIVK
jgi:hypothetical protein